MLAKQSMSRNVLNTRESSTMHINTSLLKRPIITLKQSTKLWKKTQKGMVADQFLPAFCCTNHQLTAQI